MFKPMQRAAILSALALIPILPAYAAEDLRLRDGISYYQDTDTGFPILANKIDDTAPEAGQPTFIFFAASGDLNSNRQAKRVVDLYKHCKENKIKFVIIDVDHAKTESAKQLLKNFYQGYIPQEVLLDKNGQKVWSANGEVDSKTLENKIEGLKN
ncbi:MAG: hypothetical protein K2X29_07205 [Candidatus Obscuribacterales bacterium]|nr:hypothetical protein [Candidatus Obscuribacterales bacterium]